jgi:hypothetical protein
MSDGILDFRFAICDLKTARRGSEFQSQIGNRKSQIL